MQYGLSTKLIQYKILSMFSLICIKRTVWKMILMKVGVVDTSFQHKKLEDFLRVNNNKTELFKMIDDVVNCKFEERIVIFTKDEKVLPNRQINRSNLELCNHEEGDTQLFLYV